MGKEQVGARRKVARRNTSSVDILDPNYGIFGNYVQNTRLNLSPTDQNTVMVSWKSYSTDNHHQEDYSLNSRHTVWLMDYATIRK
jgi:hypothetical protein